MPTWAQALLAVLGPVGAVLGVWLTSRASRRTTEVTGLLGLLDRQQAEMTRLDKRVTAAEAKADLCERRVDELERSQRTDRRLIDRLIDHVQQWRDWAKAVQAGRDVPPPVTPDELAPHLD